jgi:rhomboid protease GluP
MEIDDSLVAKRAAAPPGEWRPLVTWALVAVNVGFFLLEILRGGSTNPLNLYRLGDARPYEVFHQGQWWRLVTAGFLHVGVAHLVVNMLGLLTLGPFIERVLGRIWFALLYLLCGCAGMALPIAIAWHRVRAESVVGASAGIMGIVGATAAVLLAGWLRERTPMIRRRLGVVVMIAALQIVFDRFAKQVSGTAHVAGLATGFALTLAIVASTSWRRRMKNQVPRV